MHQTLSSLNVPQTAFALVYAVLWGGVVNALGRWKAFDTGAICAYKDTKACWRLVSAFLFTSVLPALWLALIVHTLSMRFWDADVTLDLVYAWKIVVAVLPAFGIFGFYRIWLWIVQRKPGTFYPIDEPLDTPWKHRFPNLTRGRYGDLDKNHAIGNLRFGVLLYIFLLSAPVLLVYFFCQMPGCRPWCQSPLPHEDSRTLSEVTTPIDMHSPGQ